MNTFIKVFKQCNIKDNWQMYIIEFLTVVCFISIAVLLVTHIQYINELIISLKG